MSEHLELHRIGGITMEILPQAPLLMVLREVMVLKSALSLRQLF